MPTLPTINSQLWAHFTRGGGLAAMLESWFSNWKGIDWLQTLGKFFDASDDFSRILAGRNVGELLLRQRNMDYLVPLRDLVTEMELSRSTVYVKQTDHTVHTLYLFLLGTWLFDHAPNLRRLYAEYYLPNDLSDRWVYDRFGLHWIFAALMHDVGYLFENIDKKTVRYRSVIDGLFRFDELQTLQGHFPYCNRETLSAARDIARGEITRWRDENAMPRFADTESPIHVLGELDKAPWLNDDWIADGDASISQFFRRSNSRIEAGGKGPVKPTVEELWEYAERVASSGYAPGSQTTTDHGFASGYLLMQLTSIRYWFVCTVADHHPQLAEALNAGSAEDRWPGFVYNADALIGSIAPACYSAASHNYLPTVLGADIHPLEIDASPLLFFSVLCDELQKWHRAPVGEAYTTAPFQFVPPNERDFYLRVGSVWSQGMPGFGCTDRSLAERIVKTVRSRLSDESLDRVFRFYGEARLAEEDISRVEM